ncbi:LamG-like jellyroll fold domain-containing protein [Flagellimonas nanhaiensis]|uniref:LamG domain-containing protein n=1 Tax=Flagellimonas nanhaiensis TaxID=2292706 RepID=A0A371JLA6_9FLAO|nr:LamG-like jellyroll fold domain-containing protein [Allomuricauda nanhaiensis]RDY57726.1 hypothetical protein DX873_17665 [Allomuricauda nanhaiensis]
MIRIFFLLIPFLGFSQVPDLLLASQQQANSGPSDSRDLPGLVYSVDDPPTDLNFLGDRQIDIGSTNIDFTPGTDEFSIVVKMGGTHPTSFSSIIAKGTSSSVQYMLGIQDGNNLNTALGGGNIVQSSNTFYSGTDLYIWTVSTTTQILRDDGTERLNAAFSGTATNASNVTIGGRSDSTSQMTGSIAWIRIYNRVLSASEISAIEAEFMYLWWIILVVPFNNRKRFEKTNEKCAA